jgi:hypothetical protein
MCLGLGELSEKNDHEKTSLGNIVEICTTDIEFNLKSELNYDALII